MDCWAEGVASTQSVSEQPVGAESSTYQAALLPDVGIQTIRIGQPFLHRVRRVAELSQDSEIGRPTCYGIREAKDLQDEMVDANDRAIGVNPKTIPNSTSTTINPCPEF